MATPNLIKRFIKKFNEWGNKDVQFKVKNKGTVRVYDTPIPVKVEGLITKDTQRKVGTIGGSGKLTYPYDWLEGIATDGVVLAAFVEADRQKMILVTGLKGVQNG